MLLRDVEKHLSQNPRPFARRVLTFRSHKCQPVVPLGENPAIGDAKICFTGATSILNVFAERFSGTLKEIRIVDLSIRASGSRSGQEAIVRRVHARAQLLVAPFGEQLTSVRANTGSRGGASASARCTRQNKNTLRLLIVARDQPSISPPAWGEGGWRPGTGLEGGGGCCPH